MKYFPLIALFFFLGAYGCTSENDGGTQEQIVPVEPLVFSGTELPKVLFSDVKALLEGSGSTVILEELMDYINATPENASIYVSIYLFEYRPIINALKAAHSRNVDLHVMVDAGHRSNNGGTVSEIKDLGEDVEIVEVVNDAGSIAINHNKFVLFSEVATETGSLEEVVFQTSHNFTTSGTKKIQDAVILSHSGLYESYLSNWKQMRNFKSFGMGDFEFFEFEDLEKGIGAMFYPKRYNGEPTGEDTAIELLEKISDPAATTVTIGMSDWADSRAYLLEKLHALLLQGANIEVVTKNGKGPEVNSGLAKLKEAGAFVKMYNMKSEGEAPKINIHTKIMMIEGMIGGKAGNLLMTGTQNFTGNAIWNNNETSLILMDHELFPKYRAFFDELKELPGIDIPLE